MKQFITHLSKSTTLIITLVSFLILCLLTNTLFSTDFTYLTQTFNYTNSEAYTLLNTIGEGGRTAHLLILIPDFLMVVLYSLFLMGANYRTFSPYVKNCKLISLITFFPLLLAAVQLGEILFVFMMLTNFAHEYANIAHVANTLTILKFNLTPLCFLLPLIGLCARLVAKIIHHRGSKDESKSY